MPFISLAIRVLLATLLSAITAVAHADTDPSKLQELGSAELADALVQAKARIESGADSAKELASDYLAVAIASARQGDAEAAQRAFVVLLGLDPSFRLPGSFPDEVRSPYLEARGFWSAHEVTLQVDVALDEARSALVLTVTDPAALSARVRLRTKVGALSEPVEIVRPSQTEISVPLTEFGETATIDYSLTLLDELGNRIWQLGDDTHPKQIVLSRAPESTLPIAPIAPSAQTLALHATHDRSAGATTKRRTLGASLSMASAALSLGGAGYAHFRREQLAHDWNAVRCQGGGITRASVCADEHRRLTRMQNLAIGLYAVGGASLITGVMLLLFAPSQSEGADARTLRCAGGPSEWSLGCSVRF